MLSIGCQPNGPRHSRDRLIFETLRKNSCSQRRLYQALCRCDYQSSNVSPYTLTLILCFSWDILFRHRTGKILFALAQKFDRSPNSTDLYFENLFVEGTLRSLWTFLQRLWKPKGTGGVRIFFRRDCLYAFHLNDSFCPWILIISCVSPEHSSFKKVKICFISTIKGTNKGNNEFVSREIGSCSLTYLLKQSTSQYGTFRVKK